MSFGAGLGSLIGSSLGAQDLSNAQSGINSNTAGVESETAPFVGFGQSSIPNANLAESNVIANAGNVQSYQDFMKNYTTSAGGQYQIQQANQAQNSSAAATGNLLSGANERALGTIDNGIASTDANTAYTNYLSGNNQAFGQLTSAFGSMLGALGVGTTATGQDVSATSAQDSATASIAAAQAKNDQSKGSGLGSMFGGLGSLATAF